MFNKPRCEKAQNLPHKLPLYCEGKFLCAHQYNCPQTRQYENTADFAKCQRLPQKEETKPQTGPVKFVVNVVPKKEDVTTNTAEVKPVARPVVEDTLSTETEVIPTPIYTKNVSPIDYGIIKETEAVTEPREKPNEKDTVTNTQIRKEQKNGGTVRNTRHRKPKKG